MKTPIVRRRFRVSVDIETTINAVSADAAEPVQYHQAFVQRLLAHPTILDQLLRGSAVDTLKEAQKMIGIEYGWNRVSEYQLFQPIIAQLEPAERAYFMEETEVGIPAIYFDGYEATVQQFSMKELDEKKEI